MTVDSLPADDDEHSPEPPRPTGLLDVLSVAAVALDTTGRIVFWTPQAEELFGYTAEDVLGKYAAQMLIRPEHVQAVVGLFTEVLETGRGWAGAFPILHKDGSSRLTEFRTMRLLDDVGDVYALGIAADHSRLQRVETDLALCERLINQSPIGLALLDPELRYLLVNPALERIDGMPAEEHIGKSLAEAVPFLDVNTVESALRQVLTTGIPLLDQYHVGRPPVDPDHEHAWSLSLYRLEDHGGRVLGAAASVVDVTERHHAAAEADRARRRLALIADASTRVGTTLEVEQTARELADICAPVLADVVAVDVLDYALAFRRVRRPENGPELFRALALKAAHPTVALRAADPPGDLAAYDGDRLVTLCVHTGRPVLVRHVGARDLPRIARDAEAGALLARAGVHSYLAVPLIAHGEVLGALDLKRTRNPLPFDDDDVVLAGELAGRAAVAIDNARWFQSVRNTALTLQRSLLPDHSPHHTGLELASRYQPAQATSEVGGDWYDVIPLAGDKTALVVGDVMGNGIDAAATMGRLRTATCAYADLDLEPAAVLQHLDKITCDLEHYIVTCLYAVFDPHTGRCTLANAGHMPPALARPGRPAVLLDLPPGAPLGVGGIAFEATTTELVPDDLLVLYTDGLVETRQHPIDDRLAVLLGFLDEPARPLEQTCDLLLYGLRHPDDHDDVALLVARAL
ncbi:SpoIIE family protein phosphatase [Streptomyces collinus]|uniref:protein-serine/threonine phosphatase n=1 Tax=Streptomyces collinus (strain DSM 40733 / Tue 365) TaxID=1214242 RepID=S5UWW7_STRC3|nr:SpoIIE family protein phosphatase [Streptomyces collinus]AGS67529.1 magnesium or manganese-dependent protein [Streptomyces collinus Tu 365]UJA06209.1 PAS domain S-box protein [Streptomyces collinus]UJA12621.1 PAS domain S-box protein [Streptomyces collinus]